MCILLVTTSHPIYTHIILNNRDEFLSRPTARTHWWSRPHSHVLGGRDLQRDVQGTWLGITRQGRIAILTNFREEGEIVPSARSRGELPKMFLGVSPDSAELPKEFAQRLVEGEGVQGVGGFSLAFGLVGREGQGRADLGIVSNRMKEAKEVKWVKAATWGLSNAHFGDRTWPKIVQGEELLDRAVKQSVERQEAKEELIERCFDVLSTDTLPKWKAGDDFHTFVKELRKSIFIPAIGGDAESSNMNADELAAAKADELAKVDERRYGTQRQTVILVDKQGKVTFVERALYDSHGRPIPKNDGDTKVEFEIEAP